MPPEVAPPRPDPLTRFDGALVASSLGLILATALMPFALQPRFAAMFRDFGAQAELPLLTRFALSPWFGLPVTLPAVGALVGLHLHRRRRWAAIAFGASAGGLILGVGLFLVAMYLPIFTLAGAIKAE